MGDCTTNHHGCALGSLMYHSDFEQVRTECFGAGGYYRMQKSEEMWTFFTTNVHDSPIDFMIMGNLGSDGTGTVSEYVFEAAPYTAFVKRECGDDAGDPSVNHMIIIDSSLGRPIHSCNYETGEECTGASSDLDDDIISGIAPGSAILYLLYSTEDGLCMKEDIHRTIFDMATVCLAAESLSVPQSQTSESAMHVEVDIDDRGHVLFGGQAPYVGWTRGNSRIVTGPTGFSNALQFEENDWLQLGDAGVEVEGSWTVECHVQITAMVQDRRDSMVLLSSPDSAIIALGSDSSDPLAFDIRAMSEGWHQLSVVFAITPSLSEEVPSSAHTRSMIEGLGGRVGDAACQSSQTGTLFDFPSGGAEQSEQIVDHSHCDWVVSCTTGFPRVSFTRFGIDGGDHLDLEGGANRVSLYGPGQSDFAMTSTTNTMTLAFSSSLNTASTGFSAHLRCALDDVHSLSYLLDGEALASRELQVCQGDPCLTQFMAVGNSMDGTSPFLLPLYRLRIFESDHVLDQSFDTPGAAPPGSMARFQPENSHSIKLSRGTDAIEVTWDTVGWNAAVHDQVHLELDHMGGAKLSSGQAQSWLWSRAIASLEGVINQDLENSSSVLNASIGVRVRYIDSDP
eukprot:COSAG06_NODE_6346_length_2974_cov_10.105434_2_plen_622_part_00